MTPGDGDEAQSPSLKTTTKLSDGLWSVVRRPILTRDRLAPASPGCGQEQLALPLGEG